MTPSAAMYCAMMSCWWYCWVALIGLLATKPATPDSLVVDGGIVAVGGWRIVGAAAAGAGAGASTEDEAGYESGC